MWHCNEYLLYVMNSLVLYNMNVFITNIPVCDNEWMLCGSAPME